ncbi:lipocalin-like domain-containing protein [Streptomyces rimosus]|uniref:lipocalin-like domain-containing protein n=1 Tax=Streptomyces rimosus TaxID=1927 RepID=UPI0031D39340
MLTADVIVGAWQLEAFEGVDDQGRTTVGPLGPSPAGLLLYLPNRQMSVSLMRTSPGTPQFMGYAGRWRIQDDHLVHHIVVSSRPDWVGTTQARFITLNGDRLCVSATGPGPVALTRPVVRWRRVPAAD